MRDEGVRARYSELSARIERAVTEARLAEPAAVAGLFASADAIFHGLNEDCVRSAKAQSFR